MKRTEQHQSANNHEVDILMGNLKKLSKEERILVGLYYYEQLTVSEIAEVLSMDHNWIRVRLEQIVPKLITLNENDRLGQNSLTEAYG